MEVVFDAAGSHTLGHDDCSALDSPADEDLGRLFVQGPGDVEDGRVVYGARERSALKDKVADFAASME